MLLTTCAACAAPLAHDAPRCVRCKTRYCNSTCQHDHWRRGHKQICKKIHRGGNAEQYHADKKYKDAAKVAVEACAAEVPAGVRCYICLDDKLGLVRGCGCSGDEGFPHLDCLVKQAQIMAEKDSVSQITCTWWQDCPLCEQHFDGAVGYAMGWAFYRAYTYGETTSGRALKSVALDLLARLTKRQGRFEEAILIYEAHVDAARVVSDETRDLSLDSIACHPRAGRLIVAAQHNISACYHALGRAEDAISLKVKCYTWTATLHRPAHDSSLKYASDAAATMLKYNRSLQCVSFSRAPIEALSANPECHWGLHLRMLAADAESHLPNYDAAKGVALFEVIIRDAQRALVEERLIELYQQGSVVARERLEQQRSQAGK